MRGLVLQGGGAKGAYEAGAVRALLQAGYSFDYVVGTSIGAINGAIIAGGDADGLYDLWTRVDLDTIFEIGKQMDDIAVLNKSASRTQVLVETVKIVSSQGLDMTKGMNFLSGLISEAKIRASAINYGLVTVSTTNRKTLTLWKQDIPDGLLLDYVFASANFPLFKRLSIEDEYFVDGGVINNFPISMFDDIELDEIVGIRLGTTIAPVSTLRADHPAKVIYIDPSEKLGKPLDFRNEVIQRYLKMGYLDAKKITDSLVGDVFYVKPMTKTDVFELFKLIPTADLVELYAMCESPDYVDESDRVELMHGVLRYLARYFRLEEENTMTLIVRACEEVVKGYTFDRLRLRTFKELLSDIAFLLSSGVVKRDRKVTEAFTDSVTFRKRTKVCKTLIGLLITNCL